MRNEDEAEVARQIAELKKRLAEKETVTECLRSETEAEEHDATIYPAAAERAKQLRDRLQIQRAELLELREELRARQAELEAAVAAREAREAADRERSAADLAEAYALKAKNAQALAVRLGAELSDLVRTGEALGHASGDADCLRAFSRAAIIERVRHTLRNEFTLPSERGPKESEKRGPGIPFPIFPYPVTPGNPLLKTTLMDSERGVLDDHARVYKTKADAIAAKQRIRDVDLHAKQMPSRMWRLVKATLRGHLAGEDAAVRDAVPAETA